MPIVIPILVLTGLLAIGVAVAAARQPPGLVAEKARPIRIRRPLRLRRLEATKVPPPPIPENPWPGVRPQTAEEFAERYAPIYLRRGTCEEWRWGFSVDDLMEDAVASGGAAMVTSLMGWIKAFTGLGVILRIFNFLFKFKLWQYKISSDASGGNAVYLAFSKWLPIPFDAPSVPLPRVDGYKRAWLMRKRANVYGIGNVFEVLLPEHRGGHWAWLVNTTDLRTALREDQIDLSTIAKHQCKEGSWSAVTYAKAIEYYR